MAIAVPSARVIASRANFSRALFNGGQHLACIQA
jgi:hypothetical protein